MVQTFRGAFIFFLALAPTPIYAQNSPVFFPSTFSRPPEFNMARTYPYWSPSPVTKYSYPMSWTHGPFGPIYFNYLSYNSNKLNPAANPFSPIPNTQFSGNFTNPILTPTIPNPFTPYFNDYLNPYNPLLNNPYTAFNNTPYTPANPASYSNPYMAMPLNYGYGGGVPYNPMPYNPLPTTPPQGYAPPAGLVGSGPKENSPLVFFGLPSEDGQVKWPLAFRLMPPQEKQASLDKLENLLGVAAVQLAQGKVSPAITEEALQAVQKMRQWLQAHQLDMAEATYQEAQEFLRKVEQRFKS